MASLLERKPLGQILVGRGTVAGDVIERALEEQRRTNHQRLIGEILLDLRACTEEQLFEALAESYGIPFARITPRLADAAVATAAGLLPKAFLEKHLVLPLFLVEGVLTVAVSEPANLFLVEEIERLAGHPVQVVAAMARDIRATLDALARGGGSVYGTDGGDAIIEEGSIPAIPAEQFAIAAGAAGDAGVPDSPVAALIRHCLYTAITGGASDVHLEPADGALRIRFRIDGRLVERLRPPLPPSPRRLHAAIVACLKTMAGLDPAESRLPCEGRIQATADKRAIDLHLTTMPGRCGEKVVVRIIDNDKAAAARLEKLGFGYDTLKHWRKLISLPGGVLLVTGPAGSGKTLTLYASLQAINSPEVNLCTIEDPVQSALHGVNQFEVNENAGFTFPVALRAALRQDPDAVMVGKLREPETARIVTQAALTGHLVFTTLHTPDAPSAFTRLLSLGVEPYLLGASVAGVLAQRLVRKLCQTCKEPYAPTMAERRQLEKFGGPPVDTLFRPRGCPRCRQLGYLGRVGIHELLAMDDALAERISQGAPLAELRNLARSVGARTLRADGIEKVKAGITTLEEVYRVTVA